MIKYVAFLRGINVGGKRLIKMEDLRRVVESLGLKNVRTFIASGNVLFETSQTNRDALTRKIEKKLLTAFGHDVPVVLQTIDELRDILRRGPFKNIKPSPDVMMCVTLLTGEPKGSPKLPLQSAIENLEVLAIKNRAAFILWRRKKNGMFSFPNNFFEKEFKVTATTRQWNTINRIVALAEAEAGP
ncbi:MAG TPA: DUF1697 domain-containing protein [Pyrinomonadaceae bacterium]|nr:DUF1697 domain-containing protein [Pyrinomonadaceae bacterium]